MQIDFTIEKYICSVIKDNSNFYVMSKFKFLCALFMVVAMNVNVNAQSYLHIPADTRSAFPVISVQSPVSIQCCWQS